MDGNLTGNIRQFLPIVGEGFPPWLQPSPLCSFPSLLHSPSVPQALHLPCLFPGHVQVAQVPGRGEPSSPGELNFPYLFQLLEDEGYQGFVGCEYRPQGEGVGRASGQAQSPGGQAVDRLVPHPCQTGNATALLLLQETRWRA